MDSPSAMGPDQSMIDNETNPETIDDIYRHIGGVGRVQKRAIFFCLLVSVTVGYQNICPVFTLRMPPHRCQIPHLQNDTYNLQDGQHIQEVNASIPLDSDGNYEKCVIWQYDDISNTSRRKVACDSWVYDKKVFSRTLAMDLNLVCDQKIMRSTANMLLFAGKFFGAVLQGLASDKFGRRRCLIVCTLGMCACTIGNAFVISIPLLFSFRFFTGMTTTATYLLAFVLGVELLEPVNRTIISTTLRLFFAVGQLSLAPFAYFLRDWQHFQLALTWSAVVAVLWLFAMIESPRWLLSKKMDEEAYEILRRMAKINKRDLPESKLTGVVIVEKLTKESPISLFRVPRLAVRWFVLYINWIVITAVYYGLTLNVSNMSGDIFVNFSFITLVDIVSSSLTGLTVNKISRKYFHISDMILSGLVLASSFIPILAGADGWIVIFLSMLGKFTISSAFYLVYIYSAELFPTNHRSFGVGSCSMSGRFGGIAAPFLADLSLFVGGTFGQILPQLICGIAGICGGILSLVLPETRGRPLPETIEDAKNFTNRPKVSKGVKKAEVI